MAEYAALGETELGYTELIEGRLLLSPSPVTHRRAGLAHRVPLAGAFGYADSGEITGTFSAIEPVGLKLDLDRLR